MRPIPAVPIDPLALKNGDEIISNPQWVLFFQLLIGQLQNILAPSGINFPPLTQEQIDQMNTTDYSGRGAYNVTMGTFMVNQNGVFKTITTT
jgi:hypothetical protein